MTDPLPPSLSLYTQCRVKLAKDRDKEDDLVAIKMIQVPEDDEFNNEEESYQYQKQIMREIESMKLVGRHRNVVQLRDVFEDVEKRRMCLVLEYVGGGDLFDLITEHGKLEEQEARRLFWQLIRGLKHVHNSGVVHRDLKPENLLLDHNHRVLKISDFGLCGLLKRHKYKNRLFETYCGTENYCCPELLSGQRYDGEKADIWSSGCILYTMLAGIYPFASENMSELIQSILNIQFEIPSHFSMGAEDLIRRILVKDPQERPSLDEIMQHPWMLEGGVSDDDEEVGEVDYSDGDDSD